jgi:nucleotide-binding universal stress UspA family protein
MLRSVTKTRTDLGVVAGTSVAWALGEPMQTLEHDFDRGVSARPVVPSTLVVGSDGSAADEGVADIALEMAALFHARVILVRALDMGIGDEPGVGAIPVAHAVLTERVAERTRVAAKAFESERLRLEVRAAGRVLVETRLVEDRPFAAICAVAEVHRESWVAVGSRRRESVLGRTVDQVLRRSSRPVLVIPDGATWPSGASVLAGIDAGELDALVLDTADMLARTLSRRLGVVHVRTNGEESTMLRVTSHLQEVAPDIAATATLSMMRVEGSIARTLVAHAARVRADLLIVGTHGRRALERWVLGSTAEALAHASRVPFLVVRHG